MSFSIKLAPGVRVRASSRGVRTSIGPRVARVHVGGGRTGVSTGLGPVSQYASLGAPRRRTTSTGSVNRQIAAAARQQALADKAAEARRLQQALDAVASIHRQDFPPAQRPLVAAPPEPPVSELRALRRAEARRATSVFDRTGRREALAEADRRAAEDVDRGREDVARQHAHHRAQADAAWAALMECERDTVLEVLNAAFADNEAAASAVGVDGAEVSVLVVVPPLADLPERKPTMTAAGNLSLKKLTKTETADLYKTLVCGHLLVTLRETFAVAPGLESARIVVIREASTVASSAGSEVVVAARCTRVALAEVAWLRASAVQVVNDVCTETRMVQKGVTGALHPVPLADEPELRALLAAVEIGDVATT